MTRAFASTLLAVLTAATQQLVWAEADAHQWLERMSVASRSLNYTGTFVYQYQNSLEAMQIVHAMDDSGERERLLSLTGPKREVLRDNRIVTCILGDSQAVVVNKSRPRTPFPVSFPRELMELEKHYRFKVMGRDRVAGLDCRMVAVEPRDEYRYGRRLCVHDQSHLLLRSEVTDAEGHAVERMMFTSVEFPQSISAQELLPNLDGADFTWQREPEQQPEPGDSSLDSRWKVVQVPDGFMLTDHNWHQLSAHDPGVEHWVYSDGLASISVYIEKSQKKHDVYSGRSHRGALNAFGTMVADHYVTVVGEVPRQTVEMIGKSVRIQ
ncbi:MAG: MucB/RseB C-terminal domain-containing protein [Gammaproteobacteria bacterium]|nr:MAG: MucB/RseB C-terminal domain-containing protein [Gammaproteobacteria bacterium]